MGGGPTKMCQQSTYVSTDTSLERDHFNFTLPTDRAIEFAVYYVDHRYTG